jgi:hypothetical protein
VSLWAGVPWLLNDGLLGLLLGRRWAVVVPEPPSAGEIVVTLPAFRAERGWLSVRIVDAATKAPLLHGLTGSLVDAGGIVGAHGIFTGPGLLVFHAIPAGSWRLVVEAEGYARASREGVTIGDLSRSPDLRLEVGRGARLAGHVTVGRERPAGAIYVHAVPDAAGFPPSTVRCADDGAFELDGLAAGAWRITADVHEVGKHVTMIARPVEVALEVGKAAAPLELRLFPIERSTIRLNGFFAEGDEPVTDRGAPEYAALLRKLGEFRVRCREEGGLVWVDETLQSLPWTVADRDLVVGLPLGQGAYTVAVDRRAAPIGARKLSSPGSAEIPVPDP